MTDQRFGGDWTEIKLNLIRDYINFFPVALRKLPFNLHYIDLFAGTGYCNIQKNGKIIKIDGSAKIALESSIPFDSYHFVENDPDSFNKLKSFCKNYPHLDITCYKDNANFRVNDICNQLNRNKDRAVMFVDPFAIDFSWAALQTVSKSKIIDVWYLFPYMALFRQVAKKKDALDDSKKKKIAYLLGDDNWEDQLYNTASQTDMFNKPSDERVQLTMVKEFIKERFEKIFPYVREPIELKNNNRPIFLLFFAISNDSPKAVGLAKKVSNEIVTKQLTRDQASDSIPYHSKDDHFPF